MNFIRTIKEFFTFSTSEKIARRRDLLEHPSRPAGNDPDINHKILQELEHYGTLFEENAKAYLLMEAIFNRNGVGKYLHAPYPDDVSGPDAVDRHGRLPYYVIWQDMDNPDYDKRYQMSFEVHRRCNADISKEEEFSVQLKYSSDAEEFARGYDFLPYSAATATILPGWFKDKLKEVGNSI